MYCVAFFFAIVQKQLDVSFQFQNEEVVAR